MYHNNVTALRHVQAFAIVRLCWHYIIPVAIFAYCYGRIFHTIRRQNKVVTGHAGRGDTTGATSEGNQTSGQLPHHGTSWP